MTIHNPNDRELILRRAREHVVPSILGQWAVFKNGRILCYRNKSVFHNRGGATRLKNEYLRVFGLNAGRFDTQLPPTYHWSTNPNRLLTVEICGVSHTLEDTEVRPTDGSRRGTRWEKFIDEELQAEIDAMYVVRQINQDDLQEATDVDTDQ